MRKRGAVGARPVLKRPAAQGDEKLSLAEVESIGDINKFRDRVRDLGVAIKYRNSFGHWVNRRKADVLDDCRRLLQRRDAVRARAAELGVKKYCASNDGPWGIWRTTVDLHEDCNNATLSAEKNSLPSFFARQLKARQAPDSEP